MYLLFDPAIPLLGIYPKDISQSQQYMHKFIHGGQLSFQNIRNNLMAHPLETI